MNAIVWNIMSQGHQSFLKVRLFQVNLFLLKGGTEIVNVKDCN